MDIKVKFMDSEKKLNLSPDFYEWFNEGITISSHPHNNDELFKYDIIINVSDEFNEKTFYFANKHDKGYFWFPMSECNSNAGLHSIYGALRILEICEQNKSKVLIHCHAGVNRSPSIKESYYVMKTGEIFSKEKTPMVYRNIFNGNLPSFKQYYDFLMLMSDSTNSLDMCILKAINYY
jgi:protein-tyrosine phosphatase